MVEIDANRAAFACILGWSLVTAAAAQPATQVQQVQQVQPAQQQGERVADDAPTLEERVAELERAVASLDTRLTVRTTGRPEQGQTLSTAVLEQRVAQLERTLAMLRADVQRIEQTAAAALRTATDAQRTAAAAEREARSAASRF